MRILPNESYKYLIKNKNKTLFFKSWNNKEKKKEKILSNFETSYLKSLSSFFFFFFLGVIFLPASKLNRQWKGKMVSPQKQQQLNKISTII